MGRKIPAKKHRGVKNPLEQQARREKSLKCKINAPPRDPDEQPVPRSLTTLFAFRDRMAHTRAPPLHKKPRPGASERKPTEEEGCRGGRAASGLRLRRLAGESGRGFSLRINEAVRALHGAGAGAGAGRLHYPQDMEAEDVKGARMAELRARRRRRGRARGAQAAPAPPAPAPPPPSPAPAPRPHLAEVRYERVQFGDVAHAPPVLRLNKQGAGASRPGRRALLLTPLLAGAGAGGGAGAGAGGGEGAAATRRELARREAVAAYRAHARARAASQRLQTPRH